MPFKDIEKQREANRKSYKKYRDRRLAFYRKEYEDNKPKHSMRKRKAYLCDPRKWLFWAAKRRAKNSGLEFTLTQNDIPVIPVLCPVLLIPLIIKSGSCGPGVNSPTLDRIDNSKGYVPDNIAIISWKANSHKGDLNIVQIERLLNYAKGQGPGPQPARFEVS